MQNITKRKDGYYQARVLTAPKTYKYLYDKSKTELKKKIEAVERELRKGLSLDEDSFAVWVDFFLDAKETEVKESQYDLIKARAEYWKSQLGALSIKSIRPVDIQPVFNRLAAENPRTHKPTAKNTLNYYKQILCGIFDYAIDNRIIDYNPADKIKTPQNAPHSTRRALTEIEQKRLLEFPHRAQLPQVLMMYSGLRRGEAAALLWSDIDLKNKTISVTKSLDYKTMELKPPKNGKSRLVSIPQVLCNFLKKQPHPSKYVVTSAKGERMTENAWKRMLDSYFYDYNLKYGKVPEDFKKFRPEKIPMSVDTWTWHCLRHTFATLMYNSGVSVLTCQEQMGHSDAKTTLAIYTHLQQEKKVQDISQLDEFLSKLQSDGV